VKTQKRPRDLNQLAASIVASATDEPEEERCPDCKEAGVVEMEDWRDGKLAGTVKIGCQACRGIGWRVVEVEDEESPAATLGRAGGLKGGKARAEKLSPERRREIAQKAAATRWERRQKA
jgi:hypothetical protein